MRDYTSTCMKRNLSATCITVLLFILSVPVFAGPYLTDPDIPDGERITYTMYQEEFRSGINSLTRVAYQEGRKIYRITTRSREGMQEAEMLSEYMLPIFVHSVTENNTYTEDTTIHLNPDRWERQPGIILLNYGTLEQVLRGFPFEDGAELKITSLMSGDGGDDSFEISIEYSGRETLSINKSRYDCHKLTMNISGKGVMGMMSKLFPKTSFWYSTDPSHYMVRYEGNNGPPGSPKTIIEIDKHPSAY